MKQWNTNPYASLHVELRKWRSGETQDWERPWGATQERLDLIQASLADGIPWAEAKQLFGEKLADPATHFASATAKQPDLHALRIRPSAPWLEVDYLSSRVTFPFLWKSGYRLRPMNLDGDVFDFASRTDDYLEFRGHASYGSNPVLLRLCRRGTGTDPDRDAEVDDVLFAWLLAIASPDLKIYAE